MDDLRYRRLKMIKDMMNNPLFNEAMHEVLQGIMAEWCVTKPADTVRREQLFAEQLALGRVVGKLQAMANEATHQEGLARHG